MFSLQVDGSVMPFIDMREHNCQILSRNKIGTLSFYMEHNFLSDVDYSLCTYLIIYTYIGIAKIGVMEKDMVALTSLMFFSERKVITIFHENKLISQDIDDSSADRTYRMYVRIFTYTFIANRWIYIR